MGTRGEDRQVGTALTTGGLSDTYMPLVHTTHACTFHTADVYNMASEYPRGWELQTLTTSSQGTLHFAVKGHCAVNGYYAAKWKGRRSILSLV